MIKTKPASSGNPQASATIYRIHQVFRDLVCTYNLQEIYVDDTDLWIGILSAAVFAVQITYRPIIFGKYMILPINHISNMRYIRHRKQEHIEKYVIHENSTIIDYNYNIGYKVMVRRNQAYKYKTPFKGPYEIVQIRQTKPLLYKRAQSQKD